MEFVPIALIIILFMFMSSGGKPKDSKDFKKGDKGKDGKEKKK